jgi:hypothetical protein
MAALFHLSNIWDITVDCMFTRHRIIQDVHTPSFSQHPKGNYPRLIGYPGRVEMSLIFVGGLSFDGSQTQPPNTSSTLTTLRAMVASLVCDEKLKGLLDWTLTTIERSACRIVSLPIVLAHEDLTPFNYLVEPTSGLRRRRP